MSGTKFQVAKFDATAELMSARAKNTHYAVSTFAAVVYALVWLLSNGANAQTVRDHAEYAVLPAVVVTAHHTTLPELVVVGVRDATMRVAVLEAIVVTGDQDARLAAIGSDHGAPVISVNSTRISYVAKVRNWVRSAIAKVAG